HYVVIQLAMVLVPQSHCGETARTLQVHQRIGVGTQAVARLGGADRGRVDEVAGASAAQSAQRGPGGDRGGQAVVDYDHDTAIENRRRVLAAVVLELPTNFDALPLYHG